MSDVYTRAGSHRSTRLRITVLQTATWLQNPVQTSHSPHPQVILTFTACCRPCGVRNGLLVDDPTRKILTTSAKTHEVDGLWIHSEAIGVDSDTCQNTFDGYLFGIGRGCLNSGYTRTDNQIAAKSTTLKHDAASPCRGIGADNDASIAREPKSHLLRHPHSSRSACFIRRRERRVVSGANDPRCRRGHRSTSLSGYEPHIDRDDRNLDQPRLPHQGPAAPIPVGQATTFEAGSSGAPRRPFLPAQPQATSSSATSRVTPSPRSAARPDGPGSWTQQARRAHASWHA